MIKNIIFDMGNVLLRYDPMLPCRRHALNESDAEQVCAALFRCPEWVSRMDAGTIDEADYLKLVQSRLETPRLKELAAKVLDDWMLDGLYPMHGMYELTEALHSRGYKLYVLSNMNRRFHEIEYKIPNYRCFEGAVVSSEEHLLKPDTAIFIRLCERFSLKPEECLFIDDVRANADGAKSAGMVGYSFEDGSLTRLREFIDGLK